VTTFLNNVEPHELFMWQLSFFSKCVIDGNVNCNDLFFQQIVDQNLSARVEELLTPIGIHVSLVCLIFSIQYLLMLWCIWKVIVLFCTVYPMLCLPFFRFCYSSSRKIDGTCDYMQYNIQIFIRLALSSHIDVLICTFFGL